MPISVVRLLRTLKDAKDVKIGLYENKMQNRKQHCLITHKNLTNQRALKNFQTCSHKVRCSGNIVTLSPTSEDILGLQRT